MSLLLLCLTLLDKRSGFESGMSGRRWNYSYRHGTHCFLVLGVNTLALGEGTSWIPGGMGGDDTSMVFCVSELSLHHSSWKYSSPELANTTFNWVCHTAPHSSDYSGLPFSFNKKTVENGRGCPISCASWQNICQHFQISFPLPFLQPY